jgi:hypothetical protein
MQILREKGYPEDSLVYEPVFNIGEKTFRPDFGVIDPLRNERLAIFEVVKSKNEFMKDRNIKRLTSLLLHPKIRNAILLLVQPAEDTSKKFPFDLFRLESDGKLKEYPIDTFPTFNALSSNETAARKDDVSEKEEKANKRFKILCFFIAFAILLIIASDIFCEAKSYKLLTSERLTLLGIIVALIVIPFAAKIKFLGIEYESLIGRKENSK